MIFFDVGANNGSSSINLARNNPKSIVYAFEPTPQMIKVIEENTSNLRNYFLIKNAVSDFNGKATFNVAGQGDWGCSSLLDFSDKSKTEWPGRHDFKVTEKIEVEVIRLDKFVKENQIKEIDHLHIDTQGSDLKVLFGLGDYISIVKKGEMEASNKKNILYNEQNTKEECIDFLLERNFEITSIDLNDHYKNEVNIFFRRK